MLIRCATAYNSFCSQIVLIYLTPFRRNSLSHVKCALQSKIAKKSPKYTYFGGSMSFNVVQCHLNSSIAVTRQKRCTRERQKHHLVHKFLQFFFSQTSSQWGRDIPPHTPPIGAYGASTLSRLRSST